MTKTNKQTQQIFQDFHQSMTDEQEKLKKGLSHLVRKTAIESERLMKNRENIELEKMEKELEK
jgi:hypothetical protein